MFHHFVSWLASTVGQLGYPGIVALMFLESSFFPFPSEIVVPPAGYLAARGEMSLPLVIAAGIAGSLLGALFNYWIAAKWGRQFFEKYGRYFLISEKTLAKADVFFERHGHISTFIGRLLVGIRQYISLPAGLARMNLFLFTLFTALGAGIWVVVLALVGYWFGGNQEYIMAHIHQISVVMLIFCAGLAVFYSWRYRKKNRMRQQSMPKR